MLITEIGTASANSESLCSVADSLTYHNARGNSTWATITVSGTAIAVGDNMQFTYNEQMKEWLRIV